MIDTPWGSLAVCDAHIHFFSHRFFASLAGQKGVPADQLAPLLNWQLPADDPGQLAGDWVREMDKHGIAKASLIASVPGDATSVIAAVERYPERFYGYMMVNPAAPEALAQSQAALASGHMHAFCFFPAMHHYSMHDDRVTALLDLLAAQPPAAAFVHCGALSLGVRKKLGLPSLFDMRYSNPIDLHEVALRFPQIRFVVPHFGAGYFREALMLCDLCPNVYLDTSSSNNWMRYEDTHLDLRAVFRRALDVAGPRRLLFGTDSSYFPRGWNSQIFEAQSKALYEIGVSDEIARLIFQDNLPHLFS
ncbi:MAG TPA: amidohydrolase family protein [Bryobacteraceae bacterium]|nr:amidohydrolase family protein [Bryobacteraceae bacterium]